MFFSLVSVAVGPMILVLQPRTHKSEVATQLARTQGRKFPEKSSQALNVRMNVRTKKGINLS